MSVRRHKSITVGQVQSIDFRSLYTNKRIFIYLTNLCIAGVAGKPHFANTGDEKKRSLHPWKCSSPAPLLQPPLHHRLWLRRPTSRPFRALDTPRTATIEYIYPSD